MILSIIHNCNKRDRIKVGKLGKFIFQLGFMYIQDLLKKYR